MIITLLVYAGVHLWYGRVEKRLQEHVPATTAVAPPLETNRQEETPKPVAEDYGVILTRNIFKATTASKTQSEVRPAQDNLDQLAETKLQLVLLGTVTGTKDDARAIIRDEKSKVEELYRVGGQVQGAVITRITRGKVALQVNGREEVLTIKDPEGDSARQGRPSRAAATSPAEMVSPEMPPEGGIERRVPETMPRRRISFRNATPAPPPVAVEEDTVVDEGQNGQGEAPADRQPLPDDEVVPRESKEAESGTEQSPN